MADNLPHSLVGLAIFVFVLGLRHGADADHLAAIDGLTRYIAHQRPRLSPWCGLLFALGHGVVVILIATSVAVTLLPLRPANWMVQFGVMVSIFSLVALGLLNLRTIALADRGNSVRPVGLRSRWFARMLVARTPVGILATGAFFAVSFDTFSQVALFSALGVQLQDWTFSVTLAALFMVAMSLVDGVDGLCVSGLLRMSGVRANAASRVMGLCVALISFGVAYMEYCEYLSPRTADTVDRYGLAVSVAVFAILSIGWLVAFRIGGRQRQHSKM